MLVKVPVDWYEHTPQIPPYCEHIPLQGAPDRLI